MTYQNSHFGLSITQQTTKTFLTMQLFGSLVSTEGIPATRSLLRYYLPSILKSKCFNENNYSFAKEVKRTEIGHLFEHILLEYLCILKIASGGENTIHNGLTRWNWKRDKRGVFHITVDAGTRDKDIFFASLEKSIELLGTILNSPQIRTFAA